VVFTCDMMLGHDQVLGSGARPKSQVCPSCDRHLGSQIKLPGLHSATRQVGPCHEACKSSSITRIPPWLIVKGIFACLRAHTVSAIGYARRHLRKMTGKDVMVQVAALPSSVYYCLPVAFSSFAPRRCSFGSAIAQFVQRNVTLSGIPLLHES
jgi:hypothetical protein